MSPTSLEQIIRNRAQQAAELNRAYEMVLADLNGHAKENKVNGFAQTIAAASRIRNEQRNGSQADSGQRKHLTPEQAQALIREVLPPGEQRSARELQAALAERGRELSRSRIVQILNAMHASRKSPSGRPIGTRWHLGPLTAEPADEPHKGRKLQKHDRRRPKTGRANLGGVIVGILRKHDGSMPLADLSDAVKAATGKGMTGAKNYIVQGLIKASGKTKKTRVYSLGPNADAAAA